MFQLKYRTMRCDCHFSKGADEEKPAEIVTDLMHSIGHAYSPGWGDLNYYDERNYTATGGGTLHTVEYGNPIHIPYYLIMTSDAGFWPSGAGRWYQMTYHYATPPPGGGDPAPSTSDGGGMWMYVPWVNGSHVNDDGSDFAITTQITLHTGGKGVVQRQSLFCLTASMTDMIANQNIPPEQIILGSAGALGADYRRWIVLPDNQSIDVTPKKVAPLQCFGYYAGEIYGGHVDQGKYHPYIKLQTSTTNANLDTDVPEVCVGQKVTFSLECLPAYAEQVGRWHLPEKYVNQATNYSSTCKTYVKNDDGLTNLTTQCWYVNQPGGKVSATWNLQFANGQQVIVICKGNFTVYRPSVTDFVNISPTITNAFTWLNGNTLSYGDRSVPTNSMKWSARIVSKYDGQMGVSQIFGAHYWVEPTLLPDPINTLSAPAADAGEFYDVGDNTPNPNGSWDYHASLTNFPVAQSVELVDYPSLQLPFTAGWGELQIADAADYIRFKPGLGSGDGNIYVTLGVVHWQAHGKYSCLDGLQINSTPPATKPDDSDGFPVWYSIIQSQTKGN